MGFLTKKPSLEDLEERKEYLAVESEVVSREADVAEKKAIIQELKRKYGRDWRKTLGFGGRLDLSTLRGLLQGMNKGLRRMSSKTTSAGISPVPGRDMRR